MDKDGWIKLHRKLLDSKIFGNRNLLQTWIYCLLRANHKENWVSVPKGTGQTEIKLEPGQFIWGRHKASEEMRMKPSTARNCLEKLKKYQKVDIKQDSKYSIITVVNWKEYQEIGQQIGQQVDNKWTTGGQQVDTDNNDNNDKNVNKEKEIYNKEKENSETLALFDEFWKLYPRRKGRKVGKAECLEFWKTKVKEVDIPDLLIAVKNYAESDLAKRDFAKDPIRFLKKDYWRDWLEPAKDPYSIEELLKREKEEL